MTRTLVATSLVLALSPLVRAENCYYNSFGQEYCSGLSNGARIGIGVGVFVVGVILICALGAMRRRRVRRINKAYALAQQNGGSGGLQPQPGFGGGSYRPSSGYGPNAGQTQYPQQAYAPGGPGTYAPPPGPPPVNNAYKPPAGGPPGAAPPQYTYDPTNV